MGFAGFIENLTTLAWKSQITEKRDFIEVLPNCQRERKKFDDF